MNIYGYEYKNIRPLSASHMHDRDLSFDQHEVVTTEGLGSFYPHILSAIQDVSYNKFTPLFLTDKKDRTQFNTLQAAVNQYPQYRTTYMKVSGSNNYLSVNNGSGTALLSATNSNKGQNSYFEFEFVDQNHCYVRHTTPNRVLQYLTVSHTTTAGLTFTARNSGVNRKTDSQIFEYMFNEPSGTITLFAHLSSSTDSSIPLVVQNHLSVGQYLSASTFSSINSGNKFYIISKSIKAPSQFNIGSSWTTYASSVDVNSNEYSISKSVSAIKNNYLVHSSLNNLVFSAHKLICDVLPLKTLLTPAGTNSKDNPYTGNESEMDHRSYASLYTGSNEENGYDNIYTGYTAGVKELRFDPDKVTYFHMPQVMSPFTSLNVNDANLYKIGAVAGDVPIKSDKVFKDLHRTRNRPTNKGVSKHDESNGTWLCSWLSGNSNPAVTPIWVDRYYNPSFHTRTTALTSGVIAPVVYTDKFTDTTRMLGASADHITIYDKRSDLTFEPGGLYAYHHVGKGNGQKILDTLNDSRIAKGLSIFNSHIDLPKPVIYTHTGPSHTWIDGLLHTGFSHSPRAVEITKLYNFNSDAYGKIECVHQCDKGSFALSFWMDNADWSKPFGNQIIGNYISKGFGFFNKDFITPLIFIPHNHKVLVYNTDFEYIDTHNVNKTIAAFTKKGNLQSYFFADSANALYEYNIDGTIINKITSSKLTGKTIVDIDIKDTFIYVLFNPSMSAAHAHYFAYDLSNKSTSYNGSLCASDIWNFGTGVSVNSAATIHAVSKGLSATRGAVVTIGEALSSRNSNVHSISGSVVLGRTTMVDNSGNPWTVQGNNVYTYDTTLSANIKALSSVNIIEALGCDSSNNIWVLHSSNKLTKLNNNRLESFTTVLSGLSSLTESASGKIHYNRNIDFVQEFDSNGNWIEYCVTINAAPSGTRLIKVDSSGKVVNVSAALSGTKASTSVPISFFNTPNKNVKTFTGHDYSRQHQRDDTQQIKAKLTVSRTYNSTTTDESYNTYTLAYPVTGIKPGQNHFAVIFDAELGKYELYINTVLVRSQSIPQGAFSYDNIFEDPIVVGSEPYHTSSFLGAHVKQPQHWLSNGIALTNIHLYKTALSYFDVKAHYDVVNDTQPIKWNIPTGQRNYIDTIDRVFGFRVPGRKSELYDINIYNTNITDITLKKDIQALISDNIQVNSPAFTKLNSIKWDGQSLSATASAAGITTSTRVHRPITFTGGVAIQGGDHYVY
jgi:hypothetical protein